MRAAVHELVDQLQAALACCPGLNKHHAQLLPDLLAVLCGLRPLVLLDYVVTCPRELQVLVARCPALQAWPGCILELARCCCFAHLPALLASSWARVEQLQLGHNHHKPQQQRQHVQQGQQQCKHQEQHTHLKAAVDREQGPAADPPAPCFLVYSPHGWSFASQQQLQVVCQQLGVLQQALEQLQGHRGPPCSDGGPPASQAQQQVSGVTPPPLPPAQVLEATAGAGLDQQDEWQQAGHRRRGCKGARHSQSLATNATPTAPGHQGVVPTSSSGGLWPVLALDHLPGLPALPTLNGWLLEYPAVYLVHTVEEAAAASKAMSSGKLQLHTLRGQLHSKVCSQLRAGDASHLLCAFSVPEAMHGDGMLQERVQQLVNAMQQRLMQGNSTQVVSSSTTTTGSVGLCTGVVDAASCWLDITISRKWVGPQAVTL